MSRKNIFIVMLLILFPVMLMPDTAWKVKKNENGIKVETRKADGYPVEEFRATTVIDIPLDTAVGIIKDVSRYTRWMYRLLEAKTISDPTAGSKIIYMKIDLPWPAVDRDMYISVSEKIDRERGMYESVNTGLTGYPATDCIRMTRVTFTWTLTADANDKMKTQVVYSSRGDPAGQLPGWICNLGNVENPYKCLYNLRYKYTTARK